ncbi:MAG: hypothetical protein COA74_06415 [Gammaproteobacteria bacterium]|nr:MAG: hypothetical protein COA74_06415 [Gammaproteobacteria bacterium]
MILKRLAEGIKNQDWFVVTIEIMIVVIGIFIGLQVNDWNETRKNHNLEARFMSELTAEIHREIDSLENKINRINKRIDILVDSIIIIQNNDPSSRLSHEQCLGILLSHIVIMDVDFVGLLSYAALSETGNIGIISDFNLHSALLAFERQVKFRATRTAYMGSDMANLTDNHADSFPRTLQPGQMVGQPKCQMDLIRSNQTVKNKLQSNLGRINALLSMLKSQEDELEALLSLIGVTK